MTSSPWWYTQYRTAEWSDELWPALSHPFSRYELQGTVSQLFRLPGSCPYWFQRNHQSYIYPWYQGFFYCGFLVAISDVPLGWSSGRIQHGGSSSRATVIVCIQRDFWWALKITSGSLASPLILDQTLQEMPTFWQRYQQLLPPKAGRGKLQEWQSYPERLKLWLQAQPVFSDGSFKRKHHWKVTHHTLLVFSVAYPQCTKERP